MMNTSQMEKGLSNIKTAVNGKVFGKVAVKSMVGSRPLPRTRMKIEMSAI